MMELKFRIFSTLLVLFILPSIALAQTQSHPLSEVWPIDVNLNMSQKNITNVSYFILSSGRYIYDTGSSIGLSSGLQLGGNLNLNSFSLTNGNWMNASSFNVSNQLCLGGICKTNWPTSLIGGSGTANYIPIWTAGDTLGNSVIYQLNNLVGIGSTSPNYLLEVGKTSSGKDVNLSDTLYVNGTSGNVGIGTTSPQAKLDVAGYIMTQGGDGRGLRLLNTGTGTYYGVGVWGDRLEWYRNQGGTWYWAMLTSLGGKWRFGGYADSAGPLLQVIGDTYISGNVGIGTTSPVKKLDVVGDVNATGDVFARGINLTAIGANGITGSGTANYIAKFTGSNTIGNSIIQDNGNVSVDSGTLFVDAVNDRVGIGTSSPQYSLHLYGSSPIQAIESTSDTGTSKLIITNTAPGGPRVTFWAIGPNYPGSGYYGLNFSDSIFINANEGVAFALGTMNSAPLILGTNNAERIRITETGNVGIGTTAPLSKLHVTGDIRHTGFLISNGSTYSSTWMKFDEDVNGNSLILGSGGLTVIGGGESADQVRANTAKSNEALFLAADNTGTSEAIRFVVGLQNGWASRVDAMTILGNGNVGIGTTSPQAKLELANGDIFLYRDFGIYSDYGGSPTAGIKFSPGTSEGLAFYTGYPQSEKVRITPTGNVGIGTTSPVKKLDVVGDVNATGDVFARGINLTAIGANGITGSGTANY
ncbi:MAG: hypothetical protein QW423_00005, partial [Candidatus Aenigmatarchaeota archaeon]